MSVHGPLEATRSGAFGLTTQGLEARTASSQSRRGVLGLSGLLITGFVISISAARTDALLPESVRPVPSWLAGPFGSTGVALGSVGLIVVLAMMLVSYLLAVEMADRLSPRMVLMCIAALHALVLLAPPLLSTDVFSYQFYGRMGALYGANPYLTGPHALALDPLYPYIGAKWTYTPTVYGPLFTALSYVLAPLSIAASAISYKLIAALSSLATVGLVWNAAGRRGVDPVKAAALVGLNPLIVVYGVGGGHNDLLMLLALVAAIYLMLQRRERSGSVLMVTAAAIKLTAGLFLPFAVAGNGGVAGSGGAQGRDRRRAILTGAGAAVAVAITFALAWFGTGPLHLLSTLQQVQTEGDWHSIPGFIATRLGLGTVGHIVGLLLFTLFVAVFCWLVRRVWRGELDWIDAAGWATVILLVTASSLLPWYVAWLMPLAALGRDRRLWRVALLMTGLVQVIQFLGYVPHLGSLSG